MQHSQAPSLFDDGQIGAAYKAPASTQPPASINLLDLLYDGFYIVFLIRNQYVPQDIPLFRLRIENLLKQFEHQAKKFQFSAGDIHDARYAYCALLDETIVTQQNTDFFQLQNHWLSEPLQLSLFGSQLAGYRFFEILETLRNQGKERLAALEVFHYCMLLGFHGKYRIEPVENLNYLVAKTGDEIDYLKGKKALFSPFSALPDQIRNVIHRELPFYWILVFLLIFSLCIFAGLKYSLGKQNHAATAEYQNLIYAPLEQAYITVYLP